MKYTTVLKTIALACGLSTFAFAGQSFAFVFNPDIIIASSPVGGVGNASDVLGVPDDINIGFDNVGATPGFVTVGFSSGLKIIDGAGADFFVALGDFTIDDNESFEVLVSQDGVTFVSLGVTAPTTNVPELSHPDILYDISGTGLSSVTQITLRNATIRGDAFEGPDIDGFRALNFTVPGVPEPATLFLVGSGLLGLAYRRKQK